jgi:hypothetical protein
MQVNTQNTMNNIFLLIILYKLSIILVLSGGYHDVDVHNTYNTYNETNNITQTDNSVSNVDSKLNLFSVAV